MHVVHAIELPLSTSSKSYVSFNGYSLTAYLSQQEGICCEIRMPYSLYVCDLYDILQVVI
jgi:hypothetical protein